MRNRFLRSVATIGLGMLLSTSAQAQEKTTILFVCEHGAAKSIIAAAEFNRLAKERGLPYHAIARGVYPDAEIPANVTKGLAADGVDTGSSKPKLVADKDIRDAKRVITLGCLLPPSKSAKKAATQDWKDIPNVSEDYKAARAAIVQRLESLLKELGSKER